MKKKFYMIMAGAAITAMAAFAATSLNGSVVGNDPGTPGNFKPIFEEGSPTADVKDDSYEVTVNVDFSAQGYAIYSNSGDEEIVNIPVIEDNQIRCQLQEEVNGEWKNIETVKYTYPSNGTSWTFTATVGEHSYRVVASIGRENISDPVKVTVKPILASIADILTLSRSENPTTDVLYVDVTDAVVTFALDDIAFIQNEEAAIAVGTDKYRALKEGDTLKGYLAGTLFPAMVNLMVTVDDSEFTVTPGADVEFGKEIDLADVDKNANRLVTFKASDDLKIETVPGGLKITQGSYELYVFDQLELGLDLDITGEIVSVTGIIYDMNSEAMPASQTPQPKANFKLQPRSESDIKVKAYTLEEALDLAPETSAKVDLAGWIVTFVDEDGRAFMQNETSAVMVQVGEDITLAENDLFLENSIADITILAENIIALNTLDADPINYMPAMPKTITPADAAANVNRLVRFEADADAPIEAEEIAENIFAADVFDVLGEDFEMPYYIESISGILMDAMAAPMDEEEAFEGFYYLAPRDEQDIVAFEFKTPAALQININKDNAEKKLEISWNPAENQAPFLVMGYKVEILSEDDEVVVASEMLNVDVRTWKTTYLPTGDYIVRVTTFFTGEETAVSTKSYNMVGISVLNADEDLQIFDLQGRRIANPAEGLYIINGKKTVIRK